MKFHQRILLHLPLVMAGVFAASTLIFLSSLQSAHLQLKTAIDTRLVADSQRRSAALSDFVSDLRQAVNDLAGGREIEAYLTNRALGMSPRYGLNASLDFIEQHFLKRIEQKTLRGQPIYKRIVLLGELGDVLVDVGEDKRSFQPVAAVDLSQRLLTDETTTRIVSSAPIIYKGEFSGTVVTAVDLKSVSRLLIANISTDTSGSGYQELLLTDRGVSILSPGQTVPLGGTVGAALAELPESKLVATSDIPFATQLKDVLALRSAIVGVPLSLVTLMSEIEAYGQLTSSAYAYYSGAFTLVLFLAALGFERMRRRAAQLQAEYCESDRHREELSQRNELLSAEIARRKLVEEALHSKTDALDRMNADLRIAAAAFDSQEGMVVLDASKAFLRVNRAFCKMTGYTPDELVGRTPEMPNPHGHIAEFLDEMWESVGRTGSWQGEIWDQAKNGEAYTRWLTVSSVKDDAGTISHYIGTFYDVSERKRAEERIKELAFFDQLTGLPNRALLLDRMRQLIKSNVRIGSYSALLFIDLDNFKMLNDTRGHDVGDLLLKQVSQRLSECVRMEDTVARFGGDEFVVLLPRLSSQETEAAISSRIVVGKILSALSEVYKLADYEHPGTCSIGVTLFSDAGQSVDDLLKRADLAMYQAKTDGRNTFRFFDPQMQTLIAARATLESDLRDALKRSEFVLHYQAQMDSKGNATGVEALLRWLHPQKGVIAPSAFIPAAENTGLILPLGAWVLETACRQLATWATRQETAHLTIAVNISALQIHHKDFVDHVLAVLESTKADPQRLKLELTESLLVRDIEDIVLKMSVLKAKGISFSLDDFGTGYSSLAYLKRLPLDQLKIDRSFVADILTDPNDAAIAKMIIVLGNSLGLEVIAEGVETESQREVLSRLGCHAYQGYLFGRPSSAEEIEEFAMRGAPSVLVPTELPKNVTIVVGSLPLVNGENIGILPPDRGEHWDGLIADGLDAGYSEGAVPGHSGTVA